MNLYSHPTVVVLACFQRLSGGFQAFGDRETLPVSGFPRPILPDWPRGQARWATPLNLPNVEAIQQHPRQGAVSSLRCGPHQPLDPVLSRPLGAARRPVDNSGELPTALLTATRHLKNDWSYLKRGLTLSGTKTHVKQRFLPLTPLLMVSDVLWSPVLPA